MSNDKRLSLNNSDEIIKYEINNSYTKEKAIKEFDELKEIALNCIDKNGNPNISAALRALENKVKIAGLYSDSKQHIVTTVSMGEILLDGEQLKLNIGEELD